MRVICPHCRTIYELQTSETDVVLVCHRCGTEFGLGEKPEGAQDVDATELRAELTPDMFTAAAEQASVVEPSQHDEPAVETTTPPTQMEASSVGEEASHSSEAAPESEPEDAANESPAVSDSETPTSDEAQAREEEASPGIVPTAEETDERRSEENAPPDDTSDSAPRAEPESEPEAALTGPPPRRKARIMPWLIVVMLLIVGGGLWVNRDAWLDDPWLRSVLLNAGIQLEIRDKDWHIDPGSVSATWLTRQGAGSVLVITGEVHNKLQTDLPPPLIHVKLFARDNPSEMILERDMVITRPPLMQAIRQAPYTPPPQDDTPIGALDKRGFVLVLEGLPQNAGNFSLQAKAR